MINLYSHGGSGNHGCEAIVRSTCNMLNDKKIQLITNNVAQDEKYNLNECCMLKSNEKERIKRGTIEWFTSALETKIMHQSKLFVKYTYKKLLNAINKEDICLSIGGDNYCYAGTDILASLNNSIRAKGAKTVLWGCSVEEDVLNNVSVSRDLSKFDLITARESITYETLKKINRKTVLVSDPAFTLQRIDLELPKGWKEGNMVGINASPLILHSSEDSKVVLDAYYKLIEYILSETDCNIVFIPHVVWDDNDDREVLRLFYDRYKNTGRVLLLDDYNCMELKGFIARCRFFIGARTHATIAAYSTCVPTLVLGYSVKSRGIARDLFGTEDNYVISVQQMKKIEALSEGFQWILENENAIKTKLTNIMPVYINNAYKAKDALEKLIKE